MPAGVAWHIVWLRTGKPVERQGRKALDLRPIFIRSLGLPGCRTAGTDLSGSTSNRFEVLGSATGTSSYHTRGGWHETTSAHLSRAHRALTRYLGPARPAGRAGYRNRALGRPGRCS